MYARVTASRTSNKSSVVMLARTHGAVTRASSSSGITVFPSNRYAFTVITGAVERRRWFDGVAGWAAAIDGHNARTIARMIFIAPYSQLLINRKGDQYCGCSKRPSRVLRWARRRASAFDTAGSVFSWR